MKKPVLFIIGIVLVAALGLLYMFTVLREDKTLDTTQNNDAAMDLQAPATDSVAVSINFGNDEEVTYIDEEGAGKSAFELLEIAALENDLEVTTEKYDFGVFVKAVGEYESSAEKAWIYFVNGNSGNVAADTYMAQPGDKIEWKYIEPTE